jgi:hypothetical protein
MLLTADSNTAAALKKAGLTCFPMNLRGAKVYKGAF